MNYQEFMLSDLFYKPNLKCLKKEYDGKGYPDHLEGEAIPVEAQIVALADAYDSLISDRTYRDAFDMSKAYGMIMSGAAGSFSEKMLDCFAQSRTMIENFCKKF